MDPGARAESGVMVSCGWPTFGGGHGAVPAWPGAPGTAVPGPAVVAAPATADRAIPPWPFDPALIQQPDPAADQQQRDDDLTNRATADKHHHGNAEQDGPDGQLPIGERVAQLPGSAWRPGLSFRDDQPGQDVQHDPHAGNQGEQDKGQPDDRHVDPVVVGQPGCHPAEGAAGVPDKAPDRGWGWRHRPSAGPGVWTGLWRREIRRTLCPIGWVVAHVVMINGKPGPGNRVFPRDDPTSPLTRQGLLRGIP